jgi:MFS family permease
MYASSVTVSIVLFVPFVYLPSFARDHGASEFASAALVGIIGGASVAGRMGLGSMADRAGVVRLYQGSFLVLALSYGIWLAAASYPVMVIFALVMGAGYGGYVALSPAVIAHLFGTNRMGTMLGALYTSGGLGAMVGPPIVGMMIDRTGSYRVAIAVAFAIAMASFALLIPLARYEPAE